MYFWENYHVLRAQFPILYFLKSLHCTTWQSRNMVILGPSKQFLCFISELRSRFRGILPQKIRAHYCFSADLSIHLHLNFFFQIEIKLFKDESGRSFSGGRIWYGVGSLALLLRDFLYLSNCTIYIPVYLSANCWIIDALHFSLLLYTVGVLINIHSVPELKHFFWLHHYDQ